MSHVKRNLNQGYKNYELSSGDTPSSHRKAKMKEEQKEENNNEVDGLSKELQMGCIVDAVKRPPNVCVETCVYESDNDEPESKVETVAAENEANDEDNYSDYFEEDFEEIEEDGNTVDAAPQPANSEASIPGKQATLKAAKSTSSMSSRANRSVCSKSNRSFYGSLPVPTTQRNNMSFTNDRLREIERQNHILLNKILSARNVQKSSIPPLQPPAKKLTASAAVQRKQQQRDIDRENMILLRKIQRAKSSASSLRR